MTEPTHPFDENLRALAEAFTYPPTPDVARAVTRRLSVAPHPAFIRHRFVPLALGVALVVALAVTIPPVRAGIIRFLQLGGVRIFLTSPTPTATLPPVTGTRFPTMTPRPTPTPIASLLDLQGEVTLAEAQDLANFTLSLPAYPADLRQPDHVFFQHFGGEPVVIFVWVDPDQPDKVRLSLHLLTCEACATKLEPTRIATTSVNGQPALWAEGPYFAELSNGDIGVTRLIEGHALIWTNGPLTYRLETDATIDEAVKIAESLQPLP